MSAAQPTQPSHRLRRPSWRDPRLITGVLLILASVAGVATLVAAQNTTHAVYAADRTLSTGDQLTEEDLRVVQVNIDDAVGHYLSADSELPENTQLLRLVSKGELIPAAALGEGDPEGRQAVTVAIDHELARGVQPGREVDVWSTAPGEDAAEVDLLAAAAEVAEIREPDSGFAATSTVTVELLVDPEEITEILAASGTGSAITVLPATSGAGS